jgi:cysteinyl-tRNA synthetase
MQMEEGLIVVIFPDGAERYLSTELFADREKTTLQIYNTLTRKKDFFIPVNPEEIRMYSCGPTIDLVYHVGSYRRFIVSDMVVRYLELKGHRVKHVTDVIDIADRAIKGAEQAGMELNEFTERCFETFLKDSEKLNIKEGAVYPKASENVDSMINLAEKLMEKGYAYEKLRSVYFDISKLDSYGRLSNIDLGKVRVGKTVDLDEYEKDNPMDFTLLKRSTLAELKRGIFYKARWGNVRPSWHMECAAISLKHLAETADIHSSGSDFVFPHCENVLAIGEAITGRKLANYWLHAEMVMMEGKKMSLSLDNYFTIEDLEKKGYEGRDIRYFLIGSHYRQPLNFSFGALDTARNTVRRLNEFVQKLLRFKAGAGYPDIDQYLYDLRKGFTNAMDDDFHVSAALAALFEFINRVNPILAKGALSGAERDKILDVLKKIDSVLGVMNFEEAVLSEEAHVMIRCREESRRRGDFRESDKLRDKLAEMGILVQDMPGGPVWRKK